MNDFAALGITINQHGPAEQRVPCPHCNHGVRDDALGANIESGAFHCFRCGWKGRAGSKNKGDNVTLNYSAARAEKHTTLSAEGRELWHACRQLSGIALEYLKARHCRLPPEGTDLRWHENLKHSSAYSGAALIALITDATTAEPISLHRTWIRANGSKADIDKPRLLLARHRKAGGVIRLWPDDCVTHRLAVGEGIETMLCAAHVCTPVWSCIDAGNLACFPVLGGIESLTIFADNDHEGLKAAHTLRQRWLEAGREVHLKIPRQSGADVADVAVS
ncbi:MAG TPA: toprim domain-containing protein [Steroidobacteraceae bacterium]|jgi:hypothetical protein